MAFIVRPPFCGKCVCLMPLPQRWGLFCACRSREGKSCLMSFIRKVGYANVDNAQGRLYLYGGFIANDETKPVGKATAVISGKLFQGDCKAASVSEGYANLVFGGVVDGKQAVLVVTLDEANKSLQGVIEVYRPRQEDEIQPELYPIAVGVGDLDKAWEYVRVLIQ